MTTPRVSVCVVTYNHEHYIHDCLMTVIAQAHDVPLEILIGDDQSTDRTEEVIRALVSRFPKVVRYFRHKTKLGPAGNYQFLIGQARGEYIAHLDGDDYWLPGKLIAQLGVLDAYPECVAAYSNAICVNHSGAFLGVFNNPVPDRFDLNLLLQSGNFLNHSSLLYRAKFGESIRGWPPKFIDYRIHLNLAHFGQLAYLNSSYVAYRVNSVGSMLVNQDELVRKLYWAAIHEAFGLTNNRSVKIAATADFLARVFLRAREVRSSGFFMEWWGVVTQQSKCNKVQLAIKVVMVVIRRRLLSLITTYFGRAAEMPFRIFHRR